MTLAGWVAVGLAGTLEAVIGEPPTRAHPVAWFGRVVGFVDREWSHPVAVGALAAGVLPVLAGLICAGLVLLAGRIGPLAAGLAAGTILFLTTSLRRLLTAAREVIAASDDRPGLARERLPALVGRDPATLAPGEIRSAAVESAAENLADGLIAPLLAFTAGVVALGSRGGTVLELGPSWVVGLSVVSTTAPDPAATLVLAGGAGTAAWVKAVNTMDSMLGYRSKRVGTPSARLDDLVMYVPARASALLLALAAGRPSTLIDARTGAREPSSPNAGWPMATIAATAGVRLRKPEAYELVYGAKLPSVEASNGCLRIVRRAGIGSYLAAALLVGVVV